MTQLYSLPPDTPPHLLPITLLLKIILVPRRFQWN